MAMSDRLIVVRDACGVVERSSDGGITWDSADPAMKCPLCSVAVSGNELWLEDMHTIAHSADRGDTWTTFYVGETLVDAGPLAAIGPNSALVANGGSVWRTTDGGAHWAQSWPSLSGES